MSTTKVSAFLILFLIAGLLSFAFAPIFVRLAGSVNPVALAVWRTIFSVVFISPFYLKYAKSEDVSEIDCISSRKKTVLTLISGSLLGLHFILWISSLSYTSVASASVLVTIHPVLLILVERIVFKVKFHRLVWLGVIISFIGSIGLGVADSHQHSGTFQNPLLGDLLAFFAAVVFAVYFLISQQVRKHTTWLGYVSPIYFWAMVLCLIAGFILPGSLWLPNSTAWTMVILMALGPQLLGHGSMNYAVKFISPTVLATTILVEPALATVLGLILFNEVPSLLAFSAMTAIVAGVFVTWFGNSRKTNS